MLSRKWQDILKMERVLWYEVVREDAEQRWPLVQGLEMSRLAREGRRNQPTCGSSHSILQWTWGVLWERQLCFSTAQNERLRTSCKEERMVAHFQVWLLLNTCSGTACFPVGWEKKFRGCHIVSPALANASLENCLRCSKASGLQSFGGFVVCRLWVCVCAFDLVKALNYTLIFWV